MILQESTSKHIQSESVQDDGRRNAFQFLYTIEPAAAALAALTVTSADITQLVELQAEMSKALKEGRYEDASLCDVRFHLMIFEAGGNSLALETIKKELPLMASTSGMLSFEQNQLAALEHEHDLLIHFLQQGDAIGANAAMLHHLYHVAVRAGMSLNIPQPQVPQMQSLPSDKASERVLVQAQSELTEREMECLRWCAAGKTAWETGRILNISEWTVVYHLEKLKRKLGVNSKRQIVGRAIALGLVSA